MMRTLSLFVLLNTAMGAGVVSAAAPTTRQDSDGREAKRLFDEGMNALDKGQFAQARDLFRASMALRSTRASAFNLAVALRGTGEVRAALACLQDILGGQYGTLDDEKRTQVKALSGELQAALSTLLIKVTGAPWAEVRVNGVLVADKQHDIRKTTTHVIDPGLAIITVGAPGMKSAEVKPTLRPGEQREIEVHLVSAVDEPGLLIVQTAPDTSINVDGVGEALGKLQRQLPPDWYKVRVHNEHGEAYERVQVRGSQTTLLSVPAPVPPLRKRPWFWVASGTVAVAAGVATWLLVTREPSPTSDPVFGTIYLLKSATPGGD